MRIRSNLMLVGAALALCNCGNTNSENAPDPDVSVSGSAGSPQSSLAGSTSHGGASGTGSSVPSSSPPGCPTAEVDLAKTYPDAAAVRTSQGSGFYTPGEGGTVTEGTYYLVGRTLHGSATVPSSESGVLEIQGKTAKLLWSRITTPNRSACSGTFSTTTTTFDATALTSCYGGTDTAFCGRSAGYTATATSLTFFVGSVEYSFAKQ
ncbi:MAG TPA: hypothetical protein VIV60_34365 [Polyangiaceae bacterium]